MHPIARTVRSQQPARTMASTLARPKSAIESQSARCLPACCGSMRPHPARGLALAGTGCCRKRKTGQSPVPRAIFAEPADVVAAQPDRHAGAASAMQPTARKSR